MNILNMLEQICACLEEGRPAVLCTIIERRGSAPRGSGARMLVCRDGRLVGTIGGGEAEGKAIDLAMKLMADADDHAWLSIDMFGSQATAVGMICGGRVDILLQRMDAIDDATALFRKLRLDCQSGLSPLLLTCIRDNESPLLLQCASGELAIPGVAEDISRELQRSACTARSPFLYRDTGLTIHVEPLIQPQTIHLAGGGHVGLAVARLAAFLDYSVIVVDDRPEFADRQRFPMACETRVVPEYALCFKLVRGNDSIVIATRGHLYDKEALGQALRTDAGYIGMIGSRKKRESVYGALLEEGYTADDLARVHCPIGLDIGGESPEEIALSIMAQIQQVRYRKIQ